MSDDGSFSVFMRTVGKNRLLTGDEEKELARRIAKGDRRASDKLAEHNVRLVISIAKSYARWGYDMEDLVQEGNVGLMKAVERFDPEKGFKFSTYATWWIRQAIHRYIAGAGGSTIRVPGRIQKIRRDITRKMGDGDMTLEQAAIALELDPVEAAEAMTGPRVAVSLDAAAFDDEGESRHSMIEDKYAVDPQQVFADTHDELRAAMKQLPQRQQDVIRCRFGFEGPPLSRQDTADELGLSIKIVQKEQSKALKTIARIIETARAEAEGLAPEEAQIEAVYKVFRESAEEDLTEPTCSKP